jgi:hypothetical protein
VIAFVGFVPARMQMYGRIITGVHAQTATRAGIFVHDPRTASWVETDRSFRTHRRTGGVGVLAAHGRDIFPCMFVFVDPDSGQFWIDRLFMPL